MSIHIETARTYIRELLPTDVNDMFDMDADPEVHKYLGNKPVKTLDESRAVIDFIRQQYTENGIARWAVTEKATGEFIGWVGFKLVRRTVNNHINYYDFGYRLTKRKWGQGFATESGKASLDYGIDRLGIKDIYAMTDVANTASRHALEKLGFRFVEIFNYDAEPTWREAAQPTTWYELIDERIM